MLLAQEGASIGQPATTPTTDGRAQAFNAVTQGGEMQSGEALLVEAYAAMWAVVFVFIFLSWRRQRATDARIVELERALAKARAAEDAKAV